MRCDMFLRIRRYGWVRYYGHPDMVIRPQPRLFTVDEYDRMADAGILGENDRVELINGKIVRMTAVGSRHAACVDRLTALLSRLLADRAIVRVQSPVRVSELSEPEPDLALLAPRDDWYAGGHPGPADALLIIEVADSSLDFDRSVKASLYAAAGVTELWIVDQTLGALETFRQPGPDGYASVRRVAPGDYLAPAAFPDVAVAVGDIFGT